MEILPSFKSFVKYIFFILLIPFGFVHGQTQSPPIHFHRGAVQIAPNVHEVSASTDWILAQTFAQKVYCLIQFKTLPSAQEKAHLAEKGIELLTYYPEQAWIAAVPLSYPWETLQQENIRAILPLTSENKVHHSLLELPLPGWTLNAVDSIDLRLTWHPGLVEKQILPALETAGARILQNQWAYGSSATIRIDQNAILSTAGLPFVQYLEPIAPPASPENYTARTLHRSNVINGAYAGSRKYDGDGVVIALGDDGRIGPHIDYQGRDDNSETSRDWGDHGDHIAGTIMGAGNLNPLHRGMAPAATIHAYEVWDAVFESPTSHIADGVMLTSTSYSNGCNAGYTNWAASADAMIRNNPSLMHVFSAGNSGGLDCGYGAGMGWGNVTGGIKIGKNVLCVGNLTYFDVLAGSSSRGPAEDGRIKPDLCAKGTSVISTIAGNQYDNYTGTSMSCPGVSGTLSQLYHAYRDLNNGNDPESALLKGVMMNTCEDLGNPGPDFNYGYGRINARRAVKTLENANYFSGSIQQNDNQVHTLTIPANIAEVRVMLYWNDWEGAPGASRPLVNDLDLVGNGPGGSSWLPWVLDHRGSRSALSTPAVRDVDHRNNVEQITLDSIQPGTYTFSVSGTSVPMGPQTYYLLYEMRDSGITLTWPQGGENFVPGETESIRWDAWGDYGTFDLDYTLDSGNTWLPLAQNIAGEERYYNWTVPALVTGNAVVRVQRSGFDAHSEAPFSIIEVPKNLRELSACPQTIELIWDIVPGAIAYDVFSLGSRYMDSIATSTTNTVTLTGTDQTQTYWFAVRARGTDGAIGRRTIAMQKLPGLRDCSEPNDIAVEAVSFPGSATYLNCMNMDQAQVRVLLRNYSPNSISQVPVSFEVQGFPVVTETFPGPLPGHSDTTFTFTQSIDLSDSGTYFIRSWAAFVPDSNRVNDTTSSTFQVAESTTETLPYSEDFETFPSCNPFAGCGHECELVNGWHNALNGEIDEIDWRTHSGPTPGTNTGPDQDHAPGTSSGRYLYLEAENCHEKEGRLISPCIDLGTVPDPELVFWFHHYGSLSGNLFVDLYAEDGWALNITSPMIAEWGNKWWERRVDLTPWAGQTVYIRWRGTTGTGNQSDMALDDIQVRSAITHRESAMETNFQVFPNPTDGEFQLQGEIPSAGNVLLTVRDLQGQTVHSSSVWSDPAFNTTLDLRNLSQGIYLLEVETQGQFFVRKLVIW